MRIVPIKYHGGNGRKKRALRKSYKTKSRVRRGQKGGFLPLLGAALTPILSGVVSKIL